MSDTGPSMQEPGGGAPQVGIAAPGHRLPAATRLGPVRLQVADLARSKRYYVDVLGLREIAARAGACELGAADGSVLVELRERPGAASVSRRGRLGLYHFALLLPERAALGSLLRHLGQLGVQPGMSDHSVSEAIYLTDPDGLGIEVYVDRPRGEWSYHGRELHMTTEPLDVNSVLAAAREPWSGMPARSVVGHVHLFVSSLESAADFYHRGLGFDRVVWSYPGALFLSAGGYHHHLGTNTWAADAAPAGADDARLLEWRIVVPDREAVGGAAAGLEAIGYAVEWGDGGWSARDPWGTTVRVVSADPDEGAGAR